MSSKYGETDSFKKDLKRLLKRFRTLEDDLEIFKNNVLELYHFKNIDSRSVFLIPGFFSEGIQIYKVKKFACKALKGRGSKSGIRIIYAYNKSKNNIDFIEIYFKGDKQNEDRQRIKEYLKNIHEKGC